MCQKRESRVDYTRLGKTDEGDDFVKRSRVCGACGHRYTTYETYEMGDVEATIKLEEVRRIIAPYVDAYPFTPA